MQSLAQRQALRPAGTTTRGALDYLCNSDTARRPPRSVVVLIALLSRNRPPTRRFSPAGEARGRASRQGVPGQGKRLIAATGEGMATAWRECRDQACACHATQVVVSAAAVTSQPAGTVTHNGATKAAEARDKNAALDMSRVRRSPQLQHARMRIEQHGTANSLVRQCCAATPRGSSQRRPREAPV